MKDALDLGESGSRPWHSDDAWRHIARAYSLRIFARACEMDFERLWLDDDAIYLTLDPVTVVHNC